MALCEGALPAFAEEPRGHTQENRTAARHLALEGSELFSARAYPQALDRFRRAYLLFEAPTLATWQARTLQRLGRWLEAEEWFVRATHWKLATGDAAAYQEAVAEAEEELEQLRADTPKIRLRLEGEVDKSLEIRLDGRVIPTALMDVHQPVDPGAHAVEVRLKGELVREIELNLLPREQRDVLLSVAGTVVPNGEAAKPSAGSARSSEPSVSSEASWDGAERSGSGWRWPVIAAAGGLGIVGIGVGVWQGLKAASLHEQLETELCTGNLCPGAELEEFRNTKRISTAAYAIGGVALGASAVLFVVTDDAPDSTAASVSAFVGWKRAGLRGRF